MSWNVPVSEHSMAVPDSSESPCEACESPAENTAPSTTTRQVHRGVIGEKMVMSHALPRQARTSRAGSASARKHQHAVRRQREGGGVTESMQRLRPGDDT